MESDIVVGTLSGSPRGLATLDGDVFVLDDETLVMLTIGDGGWTSVPIAIAMDLGGSKGLVPTGDFVYWSSIVDAGEGSIMRLRVRPQVGVPERVAPFHLPLIPGIAADDAGVWWLDTTLGLATTTEERQRHI